MKASLLYLAALFIFDGCQMHEPNASETSGSFEPDILSDANLTFTKRVASYLHVGDWVHVHLDLEFRNQTPAQALIGVQVLPPFEPAEFSTVYTGLVSGAHSEFGDTSFETAELTLSADPDAAIQITGHTASMTLPGGIPLVLGDNEIRKLVGTISYRTTGRYLY